MTSRELRTCRNRPPQAHPDERHRDRCASPLGRSAPERRRESVACPREPFRPRVQAAHALALAAPSLRLLLREPLRGLANAAHTLRVSGRLLAKCHGLRNQTEYEGGVERHDRPITDLIAGRKCGAECAGTSDTYFERLRYPMPRETVACLCIAFTLAVPLVASPAHPHLPTVRDPLG